MNKAKEPFFGNFSGLEIIPSGLQQGEGPSDIGVEEGTGLVDRAVHMGFRGKVHHRDRTVSFEKICHQ